MELRLINGQPFIITRVCKKETATPAAEVVSAARQRISDATAMLTSLDQSAAEAQTGLEAALLKGQPTAPHRQELENITELMADQRQEKSEAASDISIIHQLLDQHAAVQIKLNDQAAIDALVKPFTDFLETQNERN